MSSQCALAAGHPAGAGAPVGILAWMGAPAVRGSSGFVAVGLQLLLSQCVDTSSQCAAAAMAALAGAVQGTCAWLAKFFREISFSLSDKFFQGNKFFTLKCCDGLLWWSGVKRVQCCGLGPASGRSR